MHKAFLGLEKVNEFKECLEEQIKNKEITINELSNQLELIIKLYNYLLKKEDVKLILIPEPKKDSDTIVELCDELNFLRNKNKNLEEKVKILENNFEEYKKQLKENLKKLII